MAMEAARSAEPSGLLLRWNSISIHVPLLTHPRDGRFASIRFADKAHSRIAFRRKDGLRQGHLRFPCFTVTRTLGIEKHQIAYHASGRFIF